MEGQVFQPQRDDLGAAAVVKEELDSSRVSGAAASEVVPSEPLEMQGQKKTMRGSGGDEESEGGTTSRKISDSGRSLL